MDEDEGEEGQPVLNGSSAPYLGLVNMQIDDEPYIPGDDLGKPFITAAVGDGGGGAAPVLGGGGAFSSRDGDGASSRDSRMVTPPGGGARLDYDLGGLTPEAFDHGAAKARLKQYKKDAEDRKRKKMVAQQKEAERLNAELSSERDRMKTMQQSREADTKEKTQQRFDKGRQDREERTKARDDLKRASRIALPSGGTPLYKRREEEFARREAAEERANQNKLKQQHQKHFKKIDFAALDRDARREQQNDSSTPARLINPREKLQLPPVNAQYYHGDAMGRARQQFLNARNGNNEAREAAAKRRQAAVKYSRLVTELVPGGGASVKRRAPVRRDPVRPQRESLPNVRATGNHGGKSGRLLLHGGGGAFTSSAPSIMNEQEVKELSTRATSLNRQARQLEDDLEAGEIGPDWEQVYRSKTELTSTYIDAIRTKVELLEAVRTA